MIEQFREHGGITDIARRDLNRSHFQRFLVDPYVYLAPNPAFRAAVPAGVPLAFALAAVLARL